MHVESKTAPLSSPKPLIETKAQKTDKPASQNARKPRPRNEYTVKGKQGEQSWNGSQLRACVNGPFTEDSYEDKTISLVLACNIKTAEHNIG